MIYFTFIIHFVSLVYMWYKMYFLSFVRVRKERWIEISMEKIAREFVISVCKKGPITYI